MRHVAVAVTYAAGYGLMHHLSFSHWALFAGFRLSALLFVPYRFWPALLVGESAALVGNAVDCASEYGWLWGATYMVPPMLFTMPVVRWCRERRRLFPTTTTTNMNVLLLTTFAVALIGTSVNMATYSLMRGVEVDAFDVKAQVVAGWYFVGNYMGVLTIVPLVLLAREALLATGWRRLWVRLSESRLVMESICLLVPALALLVWLASRAAGEAAQEARVAMFLPVAWLALRHGWRGAAVGGTVASIAVVLSMPAVEDSDTLHAQVFIAFTTTTMLMLGGRIAALHEKEERGLVDARMAFAVAQRNASLGELQLRQTSYALEQMSGMIQASYNQLLGRLRCLLPGTDERSYYRQAAITQHQMYRLADSLYPLTWRERGLPAALREGAMPRALDESGISYWCEVRGTALDEMPNSLHIALYRLACEAVSLACSKRDVSRIVLHLRSGSLGGRRWALLRVDSHVEYERLGRIRWDELLPALGGSGLGLGAIKDRAAIFGGKARTRALGQGNRISVLVSEPDMF
ncbi:MASE1 domain-containing protein [Frateuria soli]|uniref:MASE1 domain-containing protein n=1 Tax=Frateuria soli TaxID=1542730 RepID=UPI001E561800|nr:MASE1 domain-containing protein [Frateuria soli]UGB39485.1 MASE1 domain-containing protein [Frateuria soli]